MDLAEFRSTLLRIDSPEAVLRLADKYLTQMQEMGSSFVLPREHSIVLPALEYYSGDLKGWVKFIKGVRDRLPVNGRSYHEGMHELYRMVNVRLTQMERRERLDAAVIAAVRKKLITDTYEEKMRYTRRCTQLWKTRRDSMLRQAASQTGKGRLSVEERETLLEQFWAGVSEEINRGELPKP